MSYVYRNKILSKYIDLNMFEKKLTNGPRTRYNSRHCLHSKNKSNELRYTGRIFTASLMIWRDCESHLTMHNFCS